MIRKREIEGDGPGRQAPDGVDKSLAVSDGTLSVTNSFTVNVQEVNKAPTLATIASQFLNEETALNLTLLGNDTDLPAQTLTYTLVSGPSGMVVSAASVIGTSGRGSCSQTSPNSSGSV